jgi:transcriptional regulator with XRE-family HTH domain
MWVVELIRSQETMNTTAFRAVPKTAQKGGSNLDESAAPQLVVKYLLEDVKLTQRELADAVGAGDRAVRRWAKEDGLPQARFLPAIDDLRDLVNILGESLPGVQTGRWLRARNRYLGGERPLDALKADKFSRVREAAEAYVEGAVL